MTGHSDVLVVGAGFAGTCASHTLAAAGFNVTLIDRRFTHPNVFRAEKIEPDQAKLMRRFGLLHHRAPVAATIGVIRRYDEQLSSQQAVDTIEQYGIDYGETVNRLIHSLPESVHRVTGTVEKLHFGNSPAIQTKDGSVYRSGLVILATGGSDRLAKIAGLRRRVDPSLRSLSFGFDIQPLNGPFDFSGFNYHLKPNDELIDYLTIFRIGDRMRVNVFSQMSVKAPEVQRIRTQTGVALERHFPGITDMIGPFRVSSRVQVVPTVFRRLVRPWKSGIVAIGEEHQSVSPTTGTGLSRVLNDVDAIVRNAANMTGHNGRGRNHLNAYYRDQAKLNEDRRSARAWMNYRDRQLRKRYLSEKAGVRFGLARIR